MLEALIVIGLVDHSCYCNLVVNVTAKKRSNLLCLNVKHACNLGSYGLDFNAIFGEFLIFIVLIFRISFQIQVVSPPRTKLFS